MLTGNKNTKIKYLKWQKFKSYLINLKKKHLLKPKILNFYYYPAIIIIPFFICFKTINIIFIIIVVIFIQYSFRWVSVCAFLTRFFFCCCFVYQCVLLLLVFYTRQSNGAELNKNVNHINFFLYCCFYCY